MSSGTRQPIRLGLMGLGKWPQEAYLPILAELPDVRVTAVAARSEATRRLASEKLGDETTVYADWADVANDPNVDAVAIALPNEHHADAIEAALSADKHIFFEPPVGLTFADTERVFAKLSASGRVVQSDLELRCLPVLGAVRDLLGPGGIGKVLTAKVRLWCDWGAGAEQPFADAQDQGFFLWLGCWYLDVLDFLFEAAPTQAGVTGGYAANGRLMDHGWATLRYPEDRIGEFEFSMVAAEGREVTLHVAGTEGEVEADLWEGTYRWRRKGKPFEEAAAPCSQPVHGFAGMRESILDFVGAIREDRRPRADLSAVRRVHEAAFACHQSESEGKQVAVQPINEV